MEVLYATGIRNQELRQLRVDDVNLEEGLLRVNDGKGGKDRVTPLGQVASRFLETYLKGIRPQLAAGRSISALFLSFRGKLAIALQALPDNEEIKELIVSYKQQEPAQIEKERVERLARPKQVFDGCLAKVKEAGLFDSHELTTDKPVKDVFAAIVNVLEHIQPPYVITGTNSPHPENYAIAASQTDKNIITTTGWRECLIVCGQSRDDETQIYFKVLEYKAKHKVTMPGLLAFKDDVEFVPIDPSRIPDMTDKLKAQLQAGVSNLTVRIQGAIGQTPVPAVQAMVPPTVPQ
jgi:hypothetical protein